MNPVSKETLLFVDDEESILDIARTYFKSRGYEVLTAGNGREAIEVIWNNRIDCCFTDINMPEMDGIEVIAGLRETRPDLPIIAISGGGRMDKDFLLDDAALFGANATLTKPFELVDLLSAVDEALEPGGAG